MRKIKSTHGGARKGAGRKKGRFVTTQKAEPTKTKRIPIAIEDVIDSIIDQHKKRLKS